MRARRAISAGKSRSSIPRKLVSGISLCAPRLLAPLVDLRLDRPHFLIGDDEEIAGAAGRVEHPDPRHAPAQVEQRAGIVARLLEARAQVVEEQRIKHFQDIRNAGVVHAQRAALLVLGDRLDHRAENVGVDLRPVEAADVEEIGARDAAEARHIQAAGKQPAVHIGEGVGPARQPGGGAIAGLGVHGAEQRADHLMGVGRVARAHLVDRRGEKVVAEEDVGVSRRRSRRSAAP